MASFDIISPIDGSVLLNRSYASGPEIEQALAKAKAAQAGWKSTSIAERKALCEKVVNYLVERASVIGEELTRQMGRPIKYTPFEVTGGFQERARYMMSIAEEKLADSEAGPKEGFRRFIRREPLGTVFVLAPWNYPFLTAVNAIIPAIMAGNTVVLKHAQQTPLVAERFAEAFAAADAPEGLFQILHLTHAQVAEVIADKRINFVAFTGSVAGGEAVQSAIGKRFITAGLELGGKDPAYVREDADLAFAIENLVDGAFFNSGQSCCGIERIYVHESQYDQFVEGFVELTKGYKLGNPLEAETTLGPMVKNSAATYVREQIKEAISKGARSLLPESHFALSQEGSPYLAPQVLTNVDHGMQLMTEESFGPVIGIMSVNSDAEAIRLMNDSQYGLTASVWTQDVETAFSIGDQIDTGTMFMNRCDYLDPELAWTGIKNSGKGVTLSSVGYEVLTRPKSFHYRLG